MTSATQITTADQLWAANIQQPCELIRGELRMMSPGNAEHGWVIMNISAPLATFVKQNNLGYVFGAETGFIIERDPDSVLAPDVAFVRRDRIPGPIPTKFFPGPPDLAVEVLSASNSALEVQEKTEEWLNSGCREVWLIDPKRKSAAICTLSGRGVRVETVDSLTSDLLPAFALPVADVFQ